VIRIVGRVPSGLPMSRRRLVASVGFAALTVVASILLRRPLTHSSWPLDQVEPWLGAAAALAYLGSFFFRARARHRLKVGVLRKLGGIRVGLGAIALSIVSLGRAPARPEPRVARARRSRRAAHVAGRAQGRDRRLVLPLRLLVGPRLRKRRAPERDRALVLAADGVDRDRPGRSGRNIPITSGGAVVNAGAAAAILLALGVAKDVAIDFSLASGLLLVISAVAASLCGVLATIAVRLAGRAGRHARV
jgi:hypothetical protein